MSSNVWKLRRTLGIVTVVLIVAMLVGSMLLAVRATSSDNALAWIEPVVFLITAVVLLPTARSFLDRRRSGIP